MIPGPTDTSFRVLTGVQADSQTSMPHTVVNGTAYDLRIRAASQNASTAGDMAEHFRRSPWVAVHDIVPSALGPVAPTGLRVIAGSGALNLSWTGAVRGR